jgi:hypothetical protein
MLGQLLVCWAITDTWLAILVAKVPDADFSDSDELSTGVGDRINLCYSSSTVTKGRGRGICIFTGMHTEIGKIASSMQGTTRKPRRSMSRKKHRLQPVKGAGLRVWDAVGKFLGLTEGTPLQIKLSKLAYALFGCAIALPIIVFAVHKFDVTSEVAIYAISTGKSLPARYRAAMELTQFRNCHHSRVPHCRFNHHVRDGNGRNETPPIPDPQIVRSGSPRWHHEHLF